MEIGIIDTLKCKYEAMQWLVMRKHILLAIEYQLLLTFRSNYDAYCHSFSTGTIDLHVDSARIVGCCAGCLVIPIVPVALHILSVRSSECMHVMSCTGVG